MNGATWTHPAGGSGGFYSRFTSAGGNGTISWSFTGLAAKRIMRQPRRIYVAARGDDDAIGANFFAAVGVSVVVTQTGAVNLDVPNSIGGSEAWGIMDLGLFNFADLAPTTWDDEAGEPTLIFRIDVTVANTKKCDVDWVCMMPTQQFMTADIAGGFQQDEAWWLDGVADKVVFEGLRMDAVLGEWRTLQPGLVMNRTIVVVNLGGGVNTGGISDDFEVSGLEIIPRTRYLFGL